MYFVHGNQDDAGIVYWLHSADQLAPRYHSHFYRHTLEISLSSNMWRCYGLSKPPKICLGKRARNQDTLNSIYCIGTLVEYLEYFRRGLSYPKNHMQNTTRVY